MARMRIFLVAAVAAAAIPVAARAQSADELVQRAQALQNEPAAFTAAAKLYESSSALRSAGDARAVEALAMAGRLYAYAGDNPHARAAFETAGSRALKDGDALTAADAYTDAAYIAAAQHDIKAVELAQRVIKIADYWVPEDRDAILARLGPRVVSALQTEPNPVMVLALMK